MLHLLFFIFTFVFSLLINGLFIKFSGTLGSKNSANKVTVIRWGSTSKPAFGGISFYIVFLASFALYASFVTEEPVIKSFFGVFIASSLGFLIGLADDAYNTRPVLKFLGQIICGVILVMTGNSIELFNNDYVNLSLTIFWVVGMMNSINMLDNMDAITTVVSVGVIVAALLTLISLGNYDHFYFWLLLGVLASLLGFLRFNWHPSKIYMGDTGSQFLGVFLAAIGIYFFWNNFSERAGHWSLRVVFPLLVFLPSIVDTTVVVINRLARKQSPFIGGKDHTTHHLSYLGFTDGQVALVFLGLSLFSVGIGLVIDNYLKEWTTYALVGAFVYCLAVFAILFVVTKKKKS